MSTIQVVSRSNYKEQHLVSLDTTLPELAPSSIRVKTSVISLTVNTLTYARLGHLLSIWSIYPLPSSTPAEFSDSNKFGRIGAWGYATVLESNVPEIEVGFQVFGLLPIGTLPQDMQVRINPQVPSQFSEVSKHREKVMSLYNQYLFYPTRSSGQEDWKEIAGQDALFRVFFMTSYLMNRFALPWDPSDFIQPGSGKDGWTIEKGTIDDKTAVLIFADSGKTALALAYLLKSRPERSLPRTVVGIGSNLSREFVRNTGLYDKLLTYDSDAGDLDLELDLKLDSKVLICEFGSRGDAGARWASKLQQTHHVVQLVAAGEVVQETPEEATKKFLARGTTGASGFNASIAKERAVEAIGEERLLKDFSRVYERYRDSGLIKGMEMVWGNGIEDVERGWEKLYKGEVKASHGLVFSLQ